MPYCAMIGKTKPKWRKFLSTTALVVAGTMTLMHAEPSYAVDDYTVPQGANVVGGSASISTPAQGQLDIHQHTDRAVINWDSFNIGAKAKTEFYQPNSNSLAVNRVVGKNADPTKILGTLKANGRVMVLDRNGVFFGPNSRVDVGGIIASTGSIDTAAIMRGDNQFVFDGFGDGEIVNEGMINATDAGLVAFISPFIKNSGVINAKLGRVGFGAGSKVTLDLYGDNLIEIALNDKAADALIEHTGAINADGGSVLITAQAAKDAVSNIVNMTGMVSAASFAEVDGKIVLKGGEQGIVDISGSMDVSGGGEIDITAQNIILSETSNLSADGGLNGDGGTVLAIAENGMVFSGTISAEGGDVSGDGGFVDVSGKNWIDFDGSVSTIAPNGEDGTLLIDPTDITISNAPDQSVSGTKTFQPSANNASSFLSISTLLTALANNNVTVKTRNGGSQQGNITVSDAITWTDNTLTLSAANDIIINSPLNGKNLTLNAGNDVQFNAAIAGTGNLTIRPNNNAKTIGVAGGAGQLDISNQDLANITDGWNKIIIGRTGGTGTITVNAASWNDVVQLQNGTGLITINGAQAMGANNLTISSKGIVDINAGLDGTGTLTLQAGHKNTSQGFAGGAGSFNVDLDSLNNIGSNWSLVQLGRSDSTVALNLGAANWDTDLHIRNRTGAINIDGVQNMDDNDLSIYSNAAVNINDTLSGTGTLYLYARDKNTGIGLAGGAGSYSISEVSLNNIADTWSHVQVGISTGKGDITMNAHTWRTKTTFLSANSAAIIVNGAQNFGDNDVTFMTRSNVELNAALTGTGNLTFRPSNTSTSIGLGGAGGTIKLTAAELDQITDGWNSITIGSLDNKSTTQLSAYTWRDDVNIYTGTGLVKIIGAQNMGSNDLTIRTNKNPQINAALTGTGVLNIQGSTDATTIGLAGGAGTLNLSATELSRITDGWSQINFGRTDSTGAITVNATSWNDDLTLQTGTGAININGVQTMGANRFFARTNGAADIILGANGGVNSSASGDAVTLAAGQNFLNNNGSSAFAGSGRWLVYSADPASDTRGGLSYDFKQYNAAYGDTLLGTGNGFIYNIAPTLTTTVTAQARAYNGATNISLAGATNVVAGAIDGDTVTVSTDNVTGSFDTKHVGAGKAISSLIGNATVASATNGGANVYGYTLTQPSAATGTVTQAALTIAAQGDTKTYNGTRVSSITPSISGLQSGDSVTGARQRFDASDAGARTLSVSAYTINDGNNGNNYSVTVNNGVNGQINKANLVITANDVSKELGSEFTFQGSEFTNSRLYATDAINSVILVSPGAVDTAALNGSPYTITPSAANGSGLENYNIVYANGELTIQPPQAFTQFNVFRQATSPVRVSGVNSRTIDVSVSRASPAAGGGGPSLNSIEPASGENSETSIAEDMSNIEPASGGDQNSQTQGETETVPLGISCDAKDGAVSSSYGQGIETMILSAVHCQG